MTKVKHNEASSRAFIGKIIMEDHLSFIMNESDRKSKISKMLSARRFFEDDSNGEWMDSDDFNSMLKEYVSKLKMSEPKDDREKADRAIEDRFYMMQIRQHAEKRARNIASHERLKAKHEKEFCQGPEIWEAFQDPSPACIELKLSDMRSAIFLALNSERRENDWRFVFDLLPKDFHK